MIRTDRMSATRLFQLFSLVCFLMASSASAQLFQAAQGGASFESGRGGVAPFPGGYYSVGHSLPVGGTADVYVVQTNNAGAVIAGWTYNFGGQDFGHDIHRCANGDFVITGVTNTAGTNDMFVMRINAAGVLQWARRISTPNDDVGVDVLQAGNGDIIAAGWANGNAAGGNRDGLMVRLTGMGGFVFTTIYFPAAAPNNDDYFHGLWQAGNGELLVSGGTTSFGGARQGWVVRTTGAGVPIWSAHLGGPNNEEFNSITQLTIGAQAGNIVAVGSTTGVPADPLDFYLVKLTGGGAFIAPDITGGTAAGAEAMFQVRENLAVNAGGILLAGRMSPGPLGMEDGYALEMNPVWNCPGGVWKNWSMAYGGAGIDRLHSAQEDPVNCFPGFIMCGRTASPALVPAGDPQQHYLIKTTNLGFSGCNEMVPGDRCTQPNFPLNPAPLNWAAGPGLIVMNPPLVNMNLGAVLCLILCPPPPPKVNLSGTGSVMQALAAAFPNPVAAGSDFQVPYLLSQDAEASIAVSDMAGRIIYNGTQQASAGSGSLTISTDGWASGAYVIRVDIGGETQTQRIVVMDK